MFDIGWTEILILGTISLFVIGPKDIPKFLGYIGRMLGKVRQITAEFRETVDDAIKNSELEEIKKEISFYDDDLSNKVNQTIYQQTPSSGKSLKSSKEYKNKKRMTKKTNNPVKINKKEG